MPERLTLDVAKGALDLLNGLIDEFPFAGAARFISTLLWPVDVVFSPVSTRIVWVDNALRCAARRGRSTLIHRCIAARNVAAVPAIDLQANRVIWIVSLGPQRRGYMDRPIARITKTKMRIKTSTPDDPSMIRLIVIRTCFGHAHLRADIRCGPSTNQTGHRRLVLWFREVCFSASKESPVECCLSLHWRGRRSTQPTSST